VEWVESTTSDQQLALLTRMYRVDRRGLLRYVAEVSDLDANLYEPMTSYSAREKDRLMQAAALGLHCEVYLVDEEPPGVGAEFTTRYEGLWQAAFVRIKHCLPIQCCLLLVAYCVYSNIAELSL
jgi:ABC-type polysaccharide/polyol phosphate transport system ATPase subunit